MGKPYGMDVCPKPSYLNFVGSSWQVEDVEGRMHDVPNWTEKESMFLQQPQYSPKNIIEPPRSNRFPWSFPAQFELRCLEMKSSKQPCHRVKEIAAVQRSWKDLQTRKGNPNETDNAMLYQSRASIYNICSFNLQRSKPSMLFLQTRYGKPAPDSQSLYSKKMLKEGCFAVPVLHSGERLVFLAWYTHRNLMGRHQLGLSDSCGSQRIRTLGPCFPHRRRKLPVESMYSPKTKRPFPLVSFDVPLNASKQVVFPRSYIRINCLEVFSSQSTVVPILGLLPVR